MKQKQRIALFGVVAVALIFAACDSDSGNNSLESEEDSSSSVEISLSSEQINSSSVVKSSSSSVGVSSSSPVVSSSSVKLQSSSSVPLSSSVVKSSSSSVKGSSSSVVASSSSVKLQSSSSVPLSSSTIESSSSSSIYGSFIYGGQTYRTVTIGTQTWMVENLNYAVDSSWCYNNSADSCIKYGRLYQWTSAMNIDTAYNSSTWGGSDVNRQGICPDGWHLPNNDDWQTLYDYVDANNGSEGVGTSLKSVDGWQYDANAAIGTDRFGFSALPAGNRYNGGGFDGAGNSAGFWSATEYDSGGAGGWILSYSYGGFGGSNYGDKNGGFSVRCLKDSE